MSTLIINGDTVKTLEDIYDIIEKTYGNNYENFGRNLDALYDILSDGEIKQIVIKNSQFFEERLKSNIKGDHTEYAALVEIFEDIPNLKITFI